MSPPAPAANPPARPLSWRASLAVYLEAPTLQMLALGFAAGLPLLLVLGTLSFRLREAGVDLGTIGELSWVGLAYAFKWAWAPLVDRLELPVLHGWLGRRRSWLLLSQLTIMAGLVGMALGNPQQGLQAVVVCALLVAFASATQDIALDAFRIESGDLERQAALVAAYQSGYRLALIWAGAGVLWLASKAQNWAGLALNQAWAVAYLLMAASMLVGVFTVLCATEPARPSLPPARTPTAWLRSALLDPFADFVRRYRWHALLILALIALYRISDVVMGIMANPFYVDMGYTKEEVAAVTKIYGVLMTLAGAFVGGTLALRVGVMRVLMLGALLSASSNLLFAWLGSHGHDLTALILVISADNLASGIASAAFIAYLSGLTNISYSATQYALFSSIMVLVPKFLAGFSGHYVEAYGYTHFFIATSLLSLPVLLLLLLAARIAPAKAQSRP